MLRKRIQSAYKSVEGQEKVISYDCRFGRVYDCGCWAAAALKAAEACNCSAADVRVFGTALDGVWQYTTTVEVESKSEAAATEKEQQ